ncbi:MAG: hypothetical protein RL685_4940 [Pseudomonadota bacterium]|jgi:hypothetical protein
MQREQQSRHTAGAPAGRDGMALTKRRLLNTGARPIDHWAANTINEAARAQSASAQSSRQRGDTAPYMALRVGLGLPGLPRLTGRPYPDRNDSAAERQRYFDKGGEMAIDAGELSGEQSAEDPEIDLRSIAEQLATLSEGEVPKDFDLEPTAFSPEEVDWSSNQWIALLGSVQEWLHLDDSFKADQRPEEALTDLFEELTETDVAECFEIGRGHARLTVSGAAALQSRLEAAVRLKDLFQSKRDADESVTAATAAWHEAWEDESSAPGNAPIEVVASPALWKIKDFCDHADEDALDLDPSYQRDAVWGLGESRMLIDSVLRGIPLPSIILNEPAGSGALEIVDGKQRLTAILRFVGRHPEGVAWAKARSNVEVPFELYKEDYRKWLSAQKKVAGVLTEESPFLPFTFLLKKKGDKSDPLHTLHGKYYHEVRDEPVTIQGQKETVKRVFESALTKYLIPIIRYEGTKQEHIQRVFGLYNKQGKQLNATELRNALYHFLDLTKLVLLLSGDNDETEKLAPYLTGSGVDLAIMPALLRGMNVNASRFNRTKLVTWVAALILTRPKEKKDKLSTPSTKGFADRLMEEIGDNSKHPMRSSKSCAAFAKAMVQGAAIVSELRGQAAVTPTFTHRKKPGVHWDDIPAVTLLAVGTLAATAGITPNDVKSRRTEVQAATKVKPLTKQQSRTQWGRISRTTISLLDALGVDRKGLALTLQNRFGYNCLATFEVMALQISTEDEK